MIFSEKNRKRPVAWNALTRIPVLVKLHTCRSTKLLLMCSQNVLLWFYKNCKQLFFTLTIAYEGFTNHFSVNAFIEKLSVMPFKKEVDLTLYQDKMNFKIYIFVEPFVLDPYKLMLQSYRNRSIGIRSLFRT